MAALTSLPLAAPSEADDVDPFIGIKEENEVALEDCYSYSMVWTELELSACFCLLEIESRDSFMCARATQMLATASIWERCLFSSAPLEMRQQFERGN